MPALATELRNKLERTVIEARDVAEAGARAALEALAVHYYEPYPHQTPEQRKLRNHLRARARQLGDDQNAKGGLNIDHLVHECAYEHWHRMLFARFLAENDFLIEPSSGVAICLQECEKLAKEAKTDLWTYASRCAQQMVPQIFHPDDPLLQVNLAREHRVKLEHLLAALNPAVFMSDDALGWVYQFWQSRRKQDVQTQMRTAGVKAGADEIPAITQLFTEEYMVAFLLENSLGAWWLSRHPDKPLPVLMPYLLRQEDGSPAAGGLSGWPDSLSEYKLLDPCCGSGHFLVAALRYLVPLRITAEGLSVRAAVDRVLTENLHGLEIDARCVEIAAFALALAAWRYPDESGQPLGYRKLPKINIACCGVAPRTSKLEWLRIARGDPRLENSLEALYDLFAQAPLLGSLIDPVLVSMYGFLGVDWEFVAPLLEKVLEDSTEETESEANVAARGMATSARLLSQRYSLVITNPPYLGRNQQDPELKDFCDKHYPTAKNNIANVFLERALRLCHPGGTVEFVMKQDWLFLGSHKEQRERLLREETWNLLVRLGPGAFETITGEVVKVILLLLSHVYPFEGQVIRWLDASTQRTLEKKKAILKEGKLGGVGQKAQLSNPDSRITFEAQSLLTLLQTVANSLQGTTTGDNPRFVAYFWEMDSRSDDWEWLRTPSDDGSAFGGNYFLLRWEQGKGELAANSAARIQGQAAFGKRGVLVGQMSSLPVSYYMGEMFDMNGAAIVPHLNEHIAAVWAYCESPDFRTEVRRIDPKLNVTNATLAKVPFDLDYWQKVAEKKYPDGLPEPESDDPTQWLFHGRPEYSTAPLQVLVARMLGYRWPAEHDGSMRLSDRAHELVKRSEELLKYSDDDGIVCIPSVRGEEPAADRLLELMTACGLKLNCDLDEWLRNSFFEEHCKLFHHRPFIWHIWDGRKHDGFNALVNYHKLAEGNGKGRELLERLVYSYLGEWIGRQQDGVKRGVDGAEERLAAAMELQKRLIAIQEGNPPFDLFVRWKPLQQQPVGWDPDINDGVRINIRPFMVSDLPNGRAGAGVLRCKPNIKWEKDRGKESQRLKSEFPWLFGWDGKTVDFMSGKEFTGERFNDCHYTVDAKRKVKEVKGG